MKIHIGQDAQRSFSRPHHTVKQAILVGKTGYITDQYSLFLFAI